MQKRIAVILGILLLAAGRLGAQTYTLSPPPFLEVRTLAGAIVPNGCVWTYAAGTTSAIATYADTSGTPNGNPIISDSYGRFVAYLLPGTNYKFAYENVPCSAPSTHGAALQTRDNIQGVPAASSNVDIVGTAGEALSAGQCAYLSDGSGAKTAGQWFKCDTGNAYSSVSAEIGITPSAIASAASGTVRLSGSVTGLSSLTVGAPYFVSTTGTITATPPTLRRFVGVADTATTLVVAGNPPGAVTIDNTGLTRVSGAQTVTGASTFSGDVTVSGSSLTFTTDSTPLAGPAIASNANLLRTSGGTLGFDWVKNDYSAQIMGLDNSGNFSLIATGTAFTSASAESLTAVISPTALAGNTNDWSPTGLATAAVIRIGNSSGAPLNLTGIVAQASGRRILLMNRGGFDITLVHQLTSSANNQFQCPGAANLLLRNMGAVFIYYSATDTKWVVVAP